MAKIVSLNPSKNYKKIGEVKCSTQEEIRQKVTLANKHKEDWGNLALEKRIRLIRSLTNAFQERKKEIARLITEEIGTPMTESLDEVNWNWEYINWFFENVKGAIRPETTHEDKLSLHRIYYEPLGTAAVITPWNLPFDMFVWGVIPNLLVGNTVIYKSAEECVLTGNLLEKIVSKIAFPRGVISFVHGGAAEGQYLTQQDVDLIWFTGSSEVGKKIYELSGKKFIKSVLEMGGSNPVIVFADADIERSVNSIVSKRFMFCGQTCDADKRIVVQKSVANVFISQLLEKTKNLKVGDPLNKTTQIGPLVSEKLLKLLDSQVEDAIKKGAIIECGGKAPEGLKGSYFMPTILTKVTRDMRVWSEEVFGPVLPIVTFFDEDEAVELANDTQYGLGSQIFTKNRKKALRIASQIQAGNVDINGVGHFKPFNPFGGYKSSGVGREHGIHGFRELCQIKTVSIPK